MWSKGDLDCDQKYKMDRQTRSKYHNHALFLVLNRKSYANDQIPNFKLDRPACFRVKKISFSMMLHD